MPPRIAEASPAGTLARLAAAALAYFALSVALTWPVAARLDSVPFADFGDARGWAWTLWTQARGPAHPERLLAAPFGTHRADVISQPVTDTLGRWLSRAAGEIAAMNILAMLGFPLTALAAFWFLHRLLEDGPAAFVGGLAFGFCPAAVMHAVGGHVSLAWNAFAVLFLFAMIHNAQRRTWRSALLVAAAFAGVLFTAIYMGYFALYLALYFVVVDVVTRREHELGRVLRNYGACAAFAALLVIPVELAAIREQLLESKEAVAKAGHSRDFGELYIYAAQSWNYLVPSVDHPVLGRHVEAFARTHIGGSNLFEQTLYLGVVPLGLLVAGLALAASGRLARRHRELFLFFAGGALVMYLVSLSARVAGIVPGVSYFAYDIVPMFRVYARAGLFVALLVACAGAVVLAHLSHTLRPRRHAALVAFLAAALAFDFWSVPPFRAQPVDPPPVYRWLAAVPGDFIVAEYPMASFDEAAHYTYPFWQRIHRKRLVNGASPQDARGWTLYEQVKDIAGPRTPELLAAAGVRYVLVHPAMYREGPIPAPIKRYYPPDYAALTFNGGVVPPIPAQLVFARAFGEDLVFEIRSPAVAGIPKAPE
jgi:hypothetical protein